MPGRMTALQQIAKSAFTRIVRDALFYCLLVAQLGLAGTAQAGERVEIRKVVDGDTVMIPRSQIRFIKGKHHQPVEKDTSLADIVGATTLPASTPETDRSDTKEHPTASPAAGIDSIPIPAGPASGTLAGRTDCPAH